MRKWKEMEREWGNGKRFTLYISSLLISAFHGHWLRSSFLVCPAMVTSTLSSAISYFQLYKPYSFWKDITLATSLHHPDLIWRSSYHHMIVGPIRYRPVPGIFLLFLILPQTNISSIFLLVFLFSAKEMYFPSSVYLNVTLSFVDLTWAQLYVSLVFSLFPRSLLAWLWIWFYKERKIHKSWV